MYTYHSKLFLFWGKRDIFYDYYILCIYTIFFFILLHLYKGKGCQLDLMQISSILYTFQNAYFYDV